MNVDKKAKQRTVWLKQGEKLLCKKMNEKDEVQTIEKIVLHASLAKRES